MLAPSVVIPNAEPALASQLDVIVLGGCGDARGNVRRTAENNMFADPEAASAVFGAEWASVSVLPWELLLAQPIPWHDFDRLLYPEAPTAQWLGGPGPLLSAACRVPFVERRGRIPGSDAAGSEPAGATISDALAVGVSLRPEMVLSSELVHVDVETQGTHTRGQTVVDWGHASDSDNRTRRVRWVTSVDMPLLTRMLEQALLPTSEAA